MYATEQFLGHDGRLSVRMIYSTMPVNPGRDRSFFEYNCLTLFLDFKEVINRGIG